MKEINTNCERCDIPLSQDEIEISKAFPRLLFAKWCESCQNHHREAQLEYLEANRKRNADTMRHEMVRKTIPPYILQTNTGHAAFNLKLLEEATKYREKTSSWVGIIGESGACKTRVMALMAKKMIFTGEEVAWTTAMEIQDKAMDEWRGDAQTGRTASGAFRHWMRCKNLFIDDIGKNTWSASVEKRFLHIIDHRYSHGLRTFWTSNKHPLEIIKEMSEDRGTAIVGKIIEMSVILNADKI